MSRFFLKSCAMVFVLAAGCFAQDWNGFYVGANAGGVKGSSNAFTNTIFSPTGYFALSSVPAIAATGNQLLSPRGFTGGGTGGYNFQHGHWVLGFEGDFGVMRAHDKFTAGPTLYPCCAPTSFTITQSGSSDWLFTVRPRIGYGTPHVLVYGTTGVAITNLNYKEDFIDTFATAHEFASTSGTLFGWTGGGGVEFKIGSGHHWSLKGEYLWVDFGTGLQTTSTNLTAFGPPAIPFPTNVFTHRIDLTTQIFRSGFNYRF